MIRRVAYWAALPICIAAIAWPGDIGPLRLVIILAAYGRLVWGRP